MKKWNKVFFTKAFVSFLLFVFLVGCSNENAKEGKKLIVGTCADFPPYEYFEDGEIVGIDAEIAKAIGEKLGYEIEIQDMDFSNVLASLESGKIQLGMAGLTVSDERQKTVDFSESYAKSIQVVLVKKDSGIQTIDDLEGKKIGGQLGTTGAIYAQDDFGEENVHLFNKYPEAVLALENEKIDAMILDKIPAEHFAKAAGKELILLDSSYTEEDFAIAIPKGKEELLKKVNQAIRELKEDGSLDKIVSKYIQGE